MKCQNCGKAIPNDLEVCPECGASVDMNPETDPAGSPMKIALWLVIISAIMMIVVVSSIFASGSIY